LKSQDFKKSFWIILKQPRIIKAVMIKKYQNMV